MPYVEIFPDAMVEESGSRTLGGGALTPLAALQDADDATYVQAAGTLAQSWNATFRFPLPEDMGLPANSRIESVRMKMRYRDAFYQPADRELIKPLRILVGRQVGTQTSYKFFTYGEQAPSYSTEPGVVYTWTGPWRTSGGVGPNWKQVGWYIAHLLNGEQARLYASVECARNVVHNTAKMTQLSLLVSYNVKPTVTVTVPATVVASRPPITWTYSDPEGDPQLKYDVRIFTQAMANLPGFLPGDIYSDYKAHPDYPPVWMDEVYTAATTAVPTRSLGQNGAALRAYVRGHQRPIAARWVYSDWATADFVLDLDTPNTPTLTATYDAAAHALKVELQGADNILSYKRSTIEGAAVDVIETDTGWRADTGSGAAIAQSAAQALHGTQSLRLTNASGAVANPMAVTGRTSARDSLIPVTALRGSTVTALASARAGSTGRVITVAVDFYQDDGVWTPAAHAPTTTTANDNNAGWVQARVVTVVPATADMARVTVTATGVAAGSTEFHYIDQVGLFLGNVSTWSQGGWIAPEPTVDDDLDDLEPMELQRSLDAGVTWETLPLNRLTRDPARQSLTYYDYELEVAQVASYRGRVTGVDPEGNEQTSDWSSVDSEAMGPTSKWWLRDIWDVTAPKSMTLAIAPGLRMRSPKPMTVGYPLDGEGAVVTHDGVKGDVLDLEVNLLDKASYDAFRALMESGRTLLLQDPYSRQWYVQPGDITYDMLRATPTAGETTPLRHAHVVKLALVSVGRPSAFGGS